MFFMMNKELKVDIRKDNISRIKQAEDYFQNTSMINHYIFPEYSNIVSHKSY